jgi:hypothetical protein
LNWNRTALSRPLLKKELLRARCLFFLIDMCAKTLN